MSNLGIYNAVRAVPPEAQKAIGGGRLKGKTDINPMWRIKALTEQFGMCGVGWKYAITRQWMEPGANNEISAFVNIELFIKVEGEWSDAIPGTGGSAFVAKEKDGPYTSDECYKMALTDAISVSCKALGFGADVYWNADATKYTKAQGNSQAIRQTLEPSPQRPQTAPPANGGATITEPQRKRLMAIGNANKVPNDVIKAEINRLGFASSKDLTKAAYDLVIAFAESYKPADTIDPDWEALGRDFIMPEEG